MQADEYKQRLERVERRCVRLSGLVVLLFAGLFGLVVIGAGRPVQRFGIIEVEGVRLADGKGKRWGSFVVTDGVVVLRLDHANGLPGASVRVSEGAVELGAWDDAGRPVPAPR